MPALSSVLDPQSSDLLGLRALARIVGGHPLDEPALAALAEPWQSLARAVLDDQAAPTRRQALTAAILRHPERARIERAFIARDPDARRADQPDAVLVRLADVAARPVRWLWPGRIPLGKLTILDGDPGLGKSVLSLDLAARLSAGRSMPDDTRPDLRGPAGVVLLSAEDALEDTIRPRLEAAGADLTRVVALTSVASRPRGQEATAPDAQRLPSLADLQPIRQAVRAVAAALVIVDPIMAYLPRGVEAGAGAAVRALLARLGALAEQDGIAVLVIRHLNKAASRNPLYRGGGSIGIIGAARSGLLVARDPDDAANARRILAETKANLVASTPSLAYRVVAADNGAPRVAWDGPTEHTAASLLERPAADGRHERTALAEARDLLRTVLADGPRPATVVLAEARAAGLSERTLRRARQALGVILRKDGFQGAWCWQLPSSATDIPSVQRPIVAS